MASEHRVAGASLPVALHLVLRTALASPHFIYRESRDGGFTLHQMASRLSYFLTTQPPDSALMGAANDGTLARPEVLQAQARRLLRDSRSELFIRSFVHQWFGTRLLAQSGIAPDPRLGDFTQSHLYWLVRETEDFTLTMLRENRPLSDFIDPDFTFTNVENGRWFYDLALTKPENVRPGYAFRVPLPRGGRAGGLLGQAAIMVATANGVDTQPVIRGKWVLETIFGDPPPPPPPPPNIPALTPDTRGAKTIRELMAAHTIDKSCASCHRKMDPFGFVLENYDPIGRWRDTYPVFSTGKDGKTITTPGALVDAKAVLPDGTTLQNATDLKRYVLQHIDRFGGCLAEKLFLHGAGRVPSYAERKLLHETANRVIQEKGGFEDLILAVIGIEAFHKQ